MFGQVMPGWTREAWAANCRRMAQCCAPYRTELAQMWAEWAAAVEGTSGGAPAATEVAKRIFTLPGQGA